MSFVVKHHTEITTENGKRVRDKIIQNLIKIKNKSRKFNKFSC